MQETPHVTHETEQALALREAIASRKAVIGVVGLGYVGIPLALAAVKGQFQVLGFDIDAAVEADQSRRELHQAHSVRGRSRGGQGQVRGDHRFRSPLEARRDPDLRADATHQVSRARSHLCGQDGASRRASACGRASSSCSNRRPIRERRRSRQADLREDGASQRRRLFPRLLSGTRGSGQRRIRHDRASPRSSAAMGRARSSSPRRSIDRCSRARFRSRRRGRRRP